MKNFPMGLMFLTMWAVAFQAANGQPTLNWERQYDLNGAEDIFNAVEVSSTRSVYLAGYGKHTSTGFEYVMVKYYYTGQRAFTSGFDFGSINKAYGVAVKGQYMYVTGRSKVGSHYKIATTKVDTGGSLVGYGISHHTTTSDDYGQFVFTNNGTGDTIYVGGTYRISSPSNSNVILLKYGLNPFGLSPVDSVVFDGFSANTDDTLKAMTIDLNNNIYLAVKSYEGALDGWDYYIAKYNRYLKEQWRKSYNSSGNATDEPNAIQVDTNGNVYVTGNGGSSALTLKYNSTGTLQWAGTYSNGYGMDVAAFNNAVYVTGGSPPGGNAILIKYNSSGTQQWAATYAPSNCSCDYTIGYRVKIDTTGNGIYVGGGHGDMVFLKYDSSGNSIWSYAYNGPSQNTDQMIDMATDVAGNILAAGAVRESDLLPPVDYDDFELVSLNVGGGFASKAAPMNPVLGTHPGRPRGYNLGQNYPNPFNPSTKISYFLSEDGRVILRIYDLLGRAVKTVLDGQYILKGPHEVSFDGSNLASGPYFYRLTVGDGKYYQVKQMMLLK